MKFPFRAYVFAVFCCSFVVAPSFVMAETSSKSTERVQTEGEEVCPEEEAAAQASKTEEEAGETEDLQKNTTKVIRPFGPGLKKSNSEKTVGSRFSRYSGNDGYENHDGIVDVARVERKRRRQSASARTASSASRAGRSRKRRS